MLTLLILFVLVVLLPIHKTLKTNSGGVLTQSYFMNLTYFFLIQILILVLVREEGSCNFTYMNIYISFSKVTLLCIIKDRHCNFCFWKEVWIVWVILYLLWLFYKKINMILWNNWGNTSRIKSVIAMFKNWKFKFDFYYLCFTLRIAVYSCLLQEWQYSLVLINHITFIKWSCLIHLRIENWCL